MTRRQRTMSRQPDIAEALAQAAREIDHHRDLSSTLSTIVTVARDSMPGIDHVGISIAYDDGRIESAATTDDLVRQLDALQYSLGEGPCLHAAFSGEDPVVVVEHAADDLRWPRYLPRAVALGVRSQLGLRLYVEEETLGALNLYSTSSDVIPEDTQHLAELFATHAALALGRTRREESLTSALTSRKTIGQAVGIVMERHD